MRIKTTMTGKLFQAFKKYSHGNFLEFLATRKMNESAAAAKNSEWRSIYLLEERKVRVLYWEDNEAYVYSLWFITWMRYQRLRSNKSIHRKSQISFFPSLKFTSTIEEEVGYTENISLTMVSWFYHCMARELMVWIHSSYLFALHK